jgi:hypothetical protein
MFLIAEIKNGLIDTIIPVQLRFSELGDVKPSDEFLIPFSYVNVIQEAQFDSNFFKRLEVEPYLENGSVYTFKLVEKTLEEKHQEQVAKIEKCRQEILEIAQVHLDNFAKIKHYDSILSAISYISSDIEEYRNDAIQCKNARDEVWSITVATVTKIDFSMTSSEDFKMLLPKLEW